MDRRVEEYSLKINRVDGSNSRMWYFHTWSQHEAVQLVRDRISIRPLRDGEDAVLNRAGECDPIEWKPVSKKS